MADEQVGRRGSLKIRRGEGALVALVDFSDCCEWFGGGMFSDSVAGRDDVGFEIEESLVAVVALDPISPWHSQSTPDVNDLILLLAVMTTQGIAEL